MSETPTYEETITMTKAILLGLPVPPGYPETEAALRSEIDALVAEGLTPDVPGD